MRAVVRVMYVVAGCGNILCTFVVGLFFSSKGLFLRSVIAV